MSNTHRYNLYIHNYVIYLQDTWETIDTYDVDHQYLNIAESNKVMILYGQIGTPTFFDFHEKLKNIAETKGINYILRHYVKVIEIRYRHCIYYRKFRFLKRFTGEGR